MKIWSILLKPLRTVHKRCTGECSRNLDIILLKVKSESYQIYYQSWRATFHISLYEIFWIPLGVWGAKLVQDLQVKSHYYSILLLGESHQQFFQPNPDQLEPFVRCGNILSIQTPETFNRLISICLMQSTFIF